MKTLRNELPLVVSATTAILFMEFGARWLSDLTDPFRLGGLIL
jgi:hypothetical protein